MDEARQQNSTLPKFLKPPVIETALGVQFDRVRDLHNARLGAFWSTVRDRFEHVEHAPLIEEARETFGAGDSWATMQAGLRLTNDPACRFKLLNSNRTRMLQLQNNRLHYNWIKQVNQEHPQYETVKPEFDKALAEFMVFCKSESLPELSFNQWEVTYVNHIPRGTVWHTPADWALLFPSVASCRPNLSYVDLESFVGQWQYEIPKQRGRLHVQIQHVRREENEDELLLLKLTARGPLLTPSIEGLTDGLAAGREAIVISFGELTSETAHEYWGEIVNGHS